MKIRYILLLILAAYSNFSLASAPPGLSDKEFKTIVTDVQQAFQADVASLGVWKEAIADLRIIDEKGSAEQKEAIERIINGPEIKEKIENQATQVIVTILKNEQLRNFIKGATLGAVKGAIPAVVLHTLILASSGKTTVEAIGPAALQAAIAGGLSGIVQLMRQAVVAGGGMAVAAGTAYASDLVNDVAKRVQAGTSYMPSPTTGLAGAFTAMVLEAITQMVEKKGGWVDFLLKNIQLTGALVPVEQGREEKALVTRHTAAFDLMVNATSAVISNKTLREYIAATGISAAQGALIGAVLHTLGLGYGPTLDMPTTVLMGAIEGLFNFSVDNSIDVGLITQLTAGLFSKVAVAGGAALALKDITPTVLRALSIGAVNQAVVKTGGWSSMMRLLAETAKGARWFIPAPVKKKEEKK